MPLRLYGVEGSQPVRSVLWLLQMKEIPYELVRVVPGHAKGTRDPAFIVRNPTGTVPFLEDPDTGVALAEGAAILTYLANKHGVTDLYPADPKQRAPVDEYLHWHHSNTRSISGGFFAPVVRQDLKSPPGVVEAHVATANKALKNFESRLGKQARLSPAHNVFPATCQLLRPAVRQSSRLCCRPQDMHACGTYYACALLFQAATARARWCAGVMRAFMPARACVQDFLCGSSPTLADLFAYPELAQCLPECCNLLDFSCYPSIEKWFARMAQVCAASLCCFIVGRGGGVIP